MIPKIESLEDRKLLSTGSNSLTESYYLTSSDGNGGTIQNWVNLTQTATIDITDNSNYTETITESVNDVFKDVYNNGSGTSVTTAIGQSNTTASSTTTVSGGIVVGVVIGGIAGGVLPTPGILPMPVHVSGNGSGSTYTPPNLFWPILPVLPSTPAPGSTAPNPTLPGNPSPPDGSGDPPTGPTSVPGGPGLPAMNSFYVDLAVDTGDEYTYSGSY